MKVKVKQIKMTMKAMGSLYRKLEAGRGKGQIFDRRGKSSCLWCSFQEKSSGWKKNPSWSSHSGGMITMWTLNLVH